MSSSPRANLAGRSEMHSVGIDIGKRQHVAAICRQGERTADKPVLRFSADRAGLADLGRWLTRHGPVAQAVAHKRVRTPADANGGPGHRAVGTAKAEQIQALAKDTIAPPELSAQIGFEMELLIAQHDLLGQQIAAAEERVARLLDGALARRLQTIPGVGPAICATLIAEIGDIFRFSEFDQLVAYA